MLSKNLSVDCDGVLVDYVKGYISNWEKMFGYKPKLISPQGLLIHTRYDIPKLEGEELANFQTMFDNQFWENLEPLPGAIEACQILNSMGYTLYCNTAINPTFKAARAENLAKNGMVFADVLCNESPAMYDRTVDISPKASAVREINAIAHFDDYPPFFRGIDQNVQNVLVSPYYAVGDLQNDIHINIRANTLLEAVHVFVENNH